MYWELLAKGLTARTRTCARCSSARVRRSRQRTPWSARWLGLVLCRCESCGRAFLLARRLADQPSNPEAEPAHIMIRDSG